jgi:hypothetical protein
VGVKDVEVVKDVTVVVLKATLLVGVLVETVLTVVDLRIVEVEVVVP